ncbi:hypothetical protein ES703_115863 [subsurface metagenome]
MFKIIFYIGVIIFKIIFCPEYLFLSKNQITEIKGLDTLIALKLLILSGNQITEIKGLENLTSLKELQLSSMT